MNGTSAGLAIRWTVGDVSSAGFEALRISIHCALHLFGDDAKYAVCVNSISLADAMARTGDVPECVQWIDNSDALPPLLASRFDPAMGEGVGWKLAPLRLFPDRHELSLDNDVILWRKPEALTEWLGQGEQCLIAQDVERRLGQFDPECPPGAFNSGIRGIPPAYLFERAIQTLLENQERRVGKPALLASELDEQGLQVAAVSLFARPFLVLVNDVAICSPFWPKQPFLGHCGAHFVGLNGHLSWEYYGRPADQWMEENWRRHRPTLYENAGIPMPETVASAPR